MGKVFVGKGFVGRGFVGRGFEASEWNPEERRVLLQHTADDKEKHIRAYFPEAMEVTKCHEDVMQGDGRGAMLRYVATYAP
eukprot:4548200-Heterocapsa_arctica.AAC.1